MIQEAMEIFQVKKSPGPDGLKPIIFEFFPKNVIEHLKFIYKSVILRYTPVL